jgi:hypothetical protein
MVGLFTHSRPLFFSVSGGDLFDLVARNGGLCESDTRFIFFQLFAGIKVKDPSRMTFVPTRDSPSTLFSYTVLA